MLRPQCSTKNMHKLLWETGLHHKYFSRKLLALNLRITIFWLMLESGTHCRLTKALTNETALRNQIWMFSTECRQTPKEFSPSSALRQIFSEYWLSGILANTSSAENEVNIKSENYAMIFLSERKTDVWCYTLYAYNTEKVHTNSYLENTPFVFLNMCVIWFWIEMNLCWSVLV